MNKSFTLIEILVVIVVIGIISSFIIVGLSSVSDKANIAKGQAFSNSLRNSLLMNLVSEFKFNASGVLDGQPATADCVKDNWGNNNGIITGTPLVRSGSNCLKDSCLEFNGSTDFVDIGTNASLTNFNQKTIIFWIKTSNGYANGAIWDGGYWDSPYGDLIYGYTDDNKITVYLKNNSGTTVSWYKQIDLKPNQWKQVGYTWNGSTVKLIENGKFISNTLSLTGTIASTTRNRFGAGNGYLKALLDELQIYNKEVSCSWISQNYYFDLNNLFVKNSINGVEYIQRFSEFKQSLINN
jgi:prepilin-type N-terminal cleavage/methylation domain-containing protein